MTNRQYYYLIAGLPDIVLDQPKMPFSVAAFREELKTHLHPEDYQLAEWLFLPADNRNLLHFFLQYANSAQLFAQNRGDLGRKCPLLAR